MIIKIQNLLFIFSSISFIFLHQSVVKSQEYPGCFIIETSGRISKLDILCKRNTQQHLRTRMNSQQLYNQGREKGKKGLYQDAILNHTQAIDLNPELAEAYVSRGTVRYLVEDKQSGIEDLYKAMDIYKSRGDVARYNIVLGMIEHINRETQMDKLN